MLESLIEHSKALQNWKFLLSFGILSAIWIILSQWNWLKSTNGTRHKFKSEGDKAEVDGKETNMEYRSYDEAHSHLDNKPHVQYCGAKIIHPGGVRAFYAMTNDRRSVRKYSALPIPIKDVEMAILAAGTSPSGAHTEPWTFCLIQDKDIKLKIREIIEAEEYLNYSQRMTRQWTVDLSPLKTDYIKEYLTEAPCLILVFKQVHGFRSDGQKQQHYYNEISTGISTGILLTALQSAGLSSLITTPLNCGPPLRNLLQRPANEKLFVLMPVGYSADDCLVPDLQRKPLENIMVKY